MKQYTEAQLFKGLEAAHKAGDVEAAKLFASEIKLLDSGGANPPQPQAKIDAKQADQELGFIDQVKQKVGDLATGAANYVDKTGQDYKSNRSDRKEIQDMSNTEVGVRKIASDWAGPVVTTFIPGFGQVNKLNKAGKIVNKLATKTKINQKPSVFGAVMGGLESGINEGVESLLLGEDFSLQDVGQGALIGGGVGKAVELVPRWLRNAAASIMSDKGDVKEQIATSLVDKDKYVLLNEFKRAKTDMLKKNPANLNADGELKPNVLSRLHETSPSLRNTTDSKTLKALEWVGEQSYFRGNKAAKTDKAFGKDYVRTMGDITDARGAPLLNKSDIKRGLEGINQPGNGGRLFNAVFDGLTGFASAGIVPLAKNAGVETANTAAGKIAKGINKNMSKKDFDAGEQFSNLIDTRAEKSIVKANKKRMDQRGENTTGLTDKQILIKQPQGRAYNKLRKINSADREKIKATQILVGLQQVLPNIFGE